MPTYDYKCSACSHTFEHFQSMKDKPLRKCPACGKCALERLIGTGAAVIFKGSGFYQTDYRSEGYKKAADADKPADTKNDASGDSKTETKAETKSDSNGADAKPATPTPGASTTNGKETRTTGGTDSAKPQAAKSRGADSKPRTSAKG